MFCTSSMTTCTKYQKRKQGVRLDTQSQKIKRTGVATAIDHPHHPLFGPICVPREYEHLEGQLIQFPEDTARAILENRHLPRLFPQRKAAELQTRFQKHSKKCPGNFLKQKSREPIEDRRDGLGLHQLKTPCFVTLITLRISPPKCFHFQNAC